MSLVFIKAGISYLVHTILGGSICEGYFVRKYLRSNPGKVLKDAYTNEDTIKYRNIIMCPGHLVAKWASEIRREVPYSEVTIIDDFSQLVELRKKGAKRTHREYYVISKDFGKLSYQSRPSISKRRYGTITKKECTDCGKEYFTSGHTCPDCSSRNYKVVNTVHRDIGMVCPSCKQILIPNKSAKLGDSLDDEDRAQTLDHLDFAVRNDGNSNCYYCEAELWEPHVANIGDNGKNRTKWDRATHYSNKAHKGTKTVWVHKDYKDEYFSQIGEEPLNIIDSEERKGNRKYSPVLFIKKYLRGYFDIAIFDEAHSYKGGSTGQGHAMHALIKISKKQLALTGTIAGGYANHLFYLLWRLDPKRMEEKGFGYEEEIKFTEKYGKLEKTYDYNGGDNSEDVYNTCCKGRQKGSPKTKPGISPLIFMDFLLDKTTFLDLSDMSKYLPPLIEKVETVEIDGELDNHEVSMRHHYRRVIDTLKKASKEKASGGKGILSTMLQYSLSYLDKPYGISSIKSPHTGAEIVRPESYNNFINYKDRNNLLSKEKRLIEIVNKEIEEGRNCFVYAEYTGSPETCITHRLKGILETYCGLEGKVEILESSSPTAAKREAWIHKKAKEGMKIIITNAKCVETGIDFCFKVDGVSYNYPTIIFYQMGYSLFTIWQASRRHFRLNQRKECRTYYMAVKGSVQEAVIQLIAEKQAATSAIQGKFSTEGLSAMAQGVDVKVKLAQAMADMDNISGNCLQEMFDVLNQDAVDDTKYANYKPMLILAELLGEEVNQIDTIITETGQELDIFDMLEIFNFDRVEEIIDKNKKAEKEIIDYSVYGVFETVEQVPLNVYIPNKKSKSKIHNGQIDLFSCY